MSGVKIGMGTITMRHQIKNQKTPTGPCKGSTVCFAAAVGRVSKKTFAVQDAIAIIHVLQTARMDFVALPMCINSSLQI